MRIVVIGDHDPANPTHAATTAGARRTRRRRRRATSRSPGCGTGAVGDPAASLAEADGVLVAPGSPYADMDGAVRAIEHARTGGVPLLGTCGGLQHLVDRVRPQRDRRPAGRPRRVPARAGRPAGRRPAVRHAPELLAGRPDDGRRRWCPGPAGRQAYGATTATERYYCNFGIAPAAGGRAGGGGPARLGGRLPRRGAGGRAAGPAVLRRARCSSRRRRARPMRPHPLVTALVVAAAGDRTGR